MQGERAKPCSWLQAQTTMRNYSCMEQCGCNSLQRPKKTPGRGPAAHLMMGSSEVVTLRKTRAVLRRGQGALGVTRS